MLEVFLTFLRLGALSFGGGLANLPEMLRLLLAKGWVTPQTFADGFALGQFVPGPNMMAVYFYGYSALGMAGGSAALLGMFIPGVVGALLILVGWKSISGTRWSKVLRRALVPLGLGLTASTLLTLFHLSIDSWGWAAVALLSGWLIHRGVAVWIVMAGGAILGLLLGS